MNRTLSALFSALESLIVMGVGLAIPLVPLTILWGTTYGFAPDWRIFWRIAADTWLLGHGTDLHLQLGAAAAHATGVAGAGDGWTLGLPALGFALLTVLLARRAGRRIGETGRRLLGEIVALVVFAILTVLVVLSAGHDFARPDVRIGVLLPPLLFLLGLVLARTHDLEDAVRSRLTPTVDGIVNAAVRGGAAAVALIFAVASVLVAIVIVANYAQIITLYEGLHSGALGGLALTVGQIMMLPDMVVWAVSWLVGPGFAIGTGSSVSPLGTTLGPIPTVPVLGALPQGDFAFAFVGLLVPIVSGFLSGALVGGRLVTHADVDRRLRWMVLSAVGLGVVGGILLALFAWAASGGVGPGRLEHTGADPLMVGLIGAGELAVSSLLGMASARRAAR